MLRLKKISLVQFKNYDNRSIDFTARVVGISGRNGIGKTNLLDAIYYLCFTKSYFTRVDTQNISHGSDGFRLVVEFELLDKRERAVCILRQTGKKEFSINDRPYEKFSQHIGHYPCVIITPDDVQIITEGSEERRRFIDSLLSQLDAGYLRYLIQYNKILLQRNSLLRSFADSGTRDLPLLTVLDKQLSNAGEKIFDRRKSFLVSFLPSVKQLYNTIARQSALHESSAENINLFYNSELLDASLPQLLAANQSKDLASLRTTSGIHRDDLEFELNGQVFRNIASQGQKKSLLFALKLAELEVLRNEKGFPPLLLLDDVFEKLDRQRITNLLLSVCAENEGQVFITDTNEQKLEEELKTLDINYQIISL